MYKLEGVDTNWPKNTTYITYTIMISVTKITIFVHSQQLNDDLLSFLKAIFSLNSSDPLACHCGHHIMQTNSTDRFPARELLNVWCDDTSFVHDSLLVDLPFAWLHSWSFRGPRWCRCVLEMPWSWKGARQSQPLTPQWSRSRTHVSPKTESVSDLAMKDNVASSFAAILVCDPY